MEHSYLTYLYLSLGTFEAVQIVKYLLSYIDQELATPSKVLLAILFAVIITAIARYQLTLLEVLVVVAMSSFIHRIWRLVTIFTSKMYLSK